MQQNAEDQKAQNTGQDGGLLLGGSLARLAMQM
jgi:hypothetical protein